jgi:ribonuclease HI
MTDTIIFTDGAARGNPGPGGWGAILATEELVEELGGGEDHTTNNRMELLAAISALEKTGFSDPIVVYTDSAYVLSGATRWIIGWQKNNWQTTQKQDVLNRDLWEKLLLVTLGRKIDWRLLKGHSGIAANERCDIIATSFADKKSIVLYAGARERYGVSLNVPDVKPVKKTSRVFTYSYVSLVNGVIQTYKTWEDCRLRVLGVPGALYKKAISPENEAEIIKEFTEKIIVRNFKPK